MTYLSDIKKAIRVKGDFDDEIDGYINACRLDLINSGIEKTVVFDEEDKLIKTAIILYVQALFGVGNSTRERDLMLYENIKISLKNAKHEGISNE